MRILAGIIEPDSWSKMFGQQATLLSSYTTELRVGFMAFEKLKRLLNVVARFRRILDCQRVALTLHVNPSKQIALVLQPINTSQDAIETKKEK